MFDENGQPMAGFGKAFKKFVRRAVPSGVRKAFKDVSKVAGKVMNAPLDLTHKLMTRLPLVKDVHKGLDKLTGGTLTSLHRTVTLPGRAMQKGRVGKGELLEAVMNVVKVGAIVVSGGSAMALVAASAGALKQGPLGKTAFGRTILSVGEFAGGGGFSKGLAKAAEKQAVNMVAKKAATEVGKKLGPLGAIAASVAVQAGASGAGAGGRGGGKISPAATNQAAKQAVQVSEVAAKKATEEMAKSGMKFSTEAATAEAKRLVVAQAKAHVATEFRKKTGIPLDIAADVAQGKVPSPAAIKQKLLSDLRNAPEHLKSELSKIDSQKKVADMGMKKVLEEKERIYVREIAKREQDVAVIKKVTAEELVAHNINYKKRAELYVTKVDVMEDLAKKAEAVRAKANNEFTNMAEKEKLAMEAHDMESQLLAMQRDIEPLADEVAGLSLGSEQIKEDSAARLAMAEFGGRTKYTSGTGLSEQNDLAHPMLQYGLV
jgi:hypothetical protein